MTTITNSNYDDDVIDMEMETSRENPCKNRWPDDDKWSIYQLLSLPSGSGGVANGLTTSGAWAAPT